MHIHNMPHVIKKTPNGYGLYNLDKKIYKSYNTSKEKAEAQKRLLQYVDAQKYKKYSKYL